MDMDKYPLNKAHQLERKAEHLKAKMKYDECIECYAEAVKHFNECLKLTDNPLSLDSVKRQIDRAERQIETLRLKKAFYEKMKKVNQMPDDRTVENLGQKIFRTMENHDSLLCFLDSQVEKVKTDEVIQESSKEGSPTYSGNKHPKNEAEVIEELKTLSSQLRESVEGLLLQLDERNKEIERLKQKIRILEEEKQREEATKNVSTLKVATDSSGGTSPYVFSPCNEFSPELNIGDLESLPALQPLDMKQLNLEFTKLGNLNSSSSDD